MSLYRNHQWQPVSPIISLALKVIRTAKTNSVPA